MRDVLQLTPVAERTVAAVMERNLAVRPGQVAVSDVAGRRLDYRQLWGAASRIAGGLGELGASRQDFVLVMLDNHIDNVVTWVGLELAAMVEVPINTAFKGDLLARVCARSGARIAIVEGAYCGRLAQVLDAVPELVTVVVRGPADADLSDRVEVVDFDALAASAPMTTSTLPRVSDIAALLFTSGTEGESKGVLMPHGQIFQIALSYPWETGPSDVVLVALPLFHSAGLFAGVYSALVGGATAVLMPNFSVSTFWDVVRRHGCTQMLMMGAMADFLWRQPPRDDDKDHPLANVCIVPAPPYLAEMGRRFGMKVSTSYGSTEVGAIAITSVEDMAPSVCGRSRSFIEMRIVDDDDVEVEPGQVGEIVVRTSTPWSLMQGYQSMADATVHAWRNLWFHTGDAGYQDDSGLFFFVDRKNDTLRRRGENVSSMEVEKTIVAFPGIAEAAVVAVPSHFTEDEIMVYLVLSDGACFEPAALLRDLSVRLPYFMVPRYCEVVAELPRTATMKVRKSELRERGITAGTWDCQAHGFKVTRHGLESLAPAP
jgi:crotonobetaine/carnitine-CoA ligase